MVQKKELKVPFLYLFCCFRQNYLSKFPNTIFTLSMARLKYFLIASISYSETFFMQTCAEHPFLG